MDEGTIKILITMCLYMAVVIGIGLFFVKRANKTSENFFFGGRSSAPIPYVPMMIRASYNYFHDVVGAGLFRNAAGASALYGNRWPTAPKTAPKKIKRKADAIKNARFLIKGFHFYCFACV